MFAVSKVVDALGDAEFPDDKVLITLAIGDPTAYDGVKAPSVATEALIKAVGTGAHNGYAASTVRLNLQEQEPRKSLYI